MDLDLTEREVPPEGEQPGVFVDVYKTVKKDKKGKHYKVLVLVGQLAATKSSGERFIASASYNLQNNRDLNRFKTHLKVWRGNNSLSNLKKFDPEAEFLGKSFVAETTVGVQDGNREIRFSGGFKTNIGEAVTVSDDFVRFKEEEPKKES